MTSTKILWRVQVRKSRAHKWVNKGLYEVRSMARIAAHAERKGGESIQITGAGCHYYRADHGGYGFGNTRVVRYVRGEK